MGIRITTWNVNGIRNPFGYQPWRDNRTFQSMFDILEADIVVMQETKIQRKDLRDDMVLVPGWDVFFSLPKYKKGYSGVAIYTRSAKCCPVRAEEGLTGVLCRPNSTTKYRELPPDQHIGGYPRPDQMASSAVDDAALDSEGRCLLLEFPAFVLLGVYSPATRDDSRTEFRLAFLAALDARIRNLVALGKEVVVAGDLNIIRSELDTAGLPEQLRKEAMTLDDFLAMPARRFLNQLVFGGRVVGDRDRDKEPVLWDVCREFHPARQGMYTCWETKKNARPGNYGSRIDYVLCTTGVKDWVEDANIQEGLLGSDHCPVYATLRDEREIDGRTVHLVDRMNPEGMFRDGKRLREWSTKDLLPLSAKLIPEFDRRRSIRDMFFKPGNTTSLKKSSTADNGGGGDYDAATRPDPDPASPSSTALAPPPQEPCASQSGSPSRGTAAAEPGNSSATKHSGSSAATAAAATAGKRQAVPSPPSNRPPKKARAALSRESSRSGLRRSQSNLMGFFKSKTPAAADSSQDAGPPGGDASQRKDASRNEEARNDASGNESRSRTAVSPKANKNRAAADTLSGRSAGGGSDDAVFDPIQAKESWSKLLGKRVPPKCEHGEECISLVTKKPGINCGRSFYICPRPLGPSGDKEQGTPFRCRTFIWSSDWNG
ncbi:hypothetical protein VTK73DRAFT_4922 [Phialemonium thermophilum]|uniref:DNA-(apurinic or apyrimidinic site) endonuclease 2 n=1 Tax=Phialemonium thermophilum TaxID=223376 RepID=A0ABR3WQY6_9PEZI